MASDFTRVIFGLGILALCVAVLVPTMIDTTNDRAVDNRELTVGNQEELTDVLFVEVESVNSTTNGTTVTYTNSRSFESNTTTTGEGNSTSVQLSGETVDYTIRDVRADNTTVLVQSEYNPTFGWNGGAQTFWDNSGLLIAILGIITVFALLIAVLKQ